MEVVHGIWGRNLDDIWVRGGYSPSRCIRLLARASLPLGATFWLSQCTENISYLWLYLERLLFVLLQMWICVEDDVFAYGSSMLKTARAWSGQSGWLHVTFIARLEYW